MDTITFTKTAAPEWLLAMWKEIDDKTFGKGSIASQRMPYAISVLPTGMDARRSEKTFGGLSTRALPRITMSWSFGTAPC